jgi:hypothetical protein
MLAVQALPGRRERGDLWVAQQRQGDCRPDTACRHSLIPLVAAYHAAAFTRTGPQPGQIDWRSQLPPPNSPPTFSARRRVRQRQHGRNRRHDDECVARRQPCGHILSCVGPRLACRTGVTNDPERIKQVSNEALDECDKSRGRQPVMTRPRDRVALQRAEHHRLRPAGSRDSSGQAIVSASSD